MTDIETHMRSGFTTHRRELVGIDRMVVGGQESAQRVWDQLLVRAVHYVLAENLLDFIVSLSSTLLYSAPPCSSSSVDWKAQTVALRYRPPGTPNTSPSNFTPSLFWPAGTRTDAYL